MNDHRSVTRSDRTAAGPEHGAAGWFVAVDGGTADSDTDRDFAEWIGEDVEHEASFARCEAAVCLADKLRSDPEMRWAYEEIEPLLVDGAAPPRWGSLRRWLSAPRALAAVGASVVLVVLGAIIFSTLRIESSSVAGSQSQPDLLGDTLAPEDDRLEGEVSLPASESSSQTLADIQTLADLIELIRSGEPAHFDRFPLDALVVRKLIMVQEPSRSRVLVEMPDGTVGYASVGDYLGEDDLRITDITTTAVVLEDGTHIRFEEWEAQ